MHRPRPRGSVWPLLNGLGSHSSTRERRALRRLNRLPPSALPELTAAVQRHPNAFARAVAARALSRFGLRARRSLLRAILDPAIPVRLHALLALEEIWSPSMAPTVIMLLDDPSPGIRTNAVAVLARRRVRQAAPKLIRVLGDPAWHVRQQAASALGIFGANRSRPALILAASDKRKAVREAAKRSLALLGTTECGSCSSHRGCITTSTRAALRSRVT